MRDLAHMADDDLRVMRRTGNAPTDKDGVPLDIHHHEQQADGPFIEMATNKHDVGNPRQHPKGNKKGDGLTEQERQEFNSWRRKYWRARARDELGKRGVQ